MRSYLLATLSVAILASCAAAQSNADSIKVRNNCRLAAKIIATGHPAPHEEWAFGFIGNCPAEAGPAIASGMRFHRNATDTSLLNELTFSTRFLHDEAILDAALEIAADKSASFQARIFSLRSLIWLTETKPGFLSYRSLAPGTPYQGYRFCPLNTTTDSRVRPGTTPLPPDYRDRIRAMATHLEADSNEADDIRGIAWCLKQ